MKLPKPAPKYDINVAARSVQIIEQADGQNRKRGQDIHLSTDRLILTSPGGHTFALTVSDSGTLGTTELT